MAVRSRAPQAVQDISTQSSFAPWRQVATAHGFRAAAVLPLISQGTVLGVFGIFAAEPLAFIAPEIELLEQLAHDIAYGLYNLRLRAAQQRTEAHLKESEERFQATFDQAAVGIAHVNPQGKIILANRALCKILGYEPGGLLGRTVKELSHPDDVDVTDKARAQLQAGEIDTFFIDKRYLRQDGSTVWIGLTVSLMRSADGLPQYDIAVFEDITERKRVEAANAKHALHQRLVAEFGQFALGNWELDQLMEKAAAHVAGGLGVEFCKILEWLPNQNCWLMRAGVGWKAPAVSGMMLGLDHELHAACCLRGKEAVVSEDFGNETRFTLSASYRHAGIRSGIAVIIHGSSAPFGALTACATKARKFSNDEVSYVQTIANVLAAAIEGKEAEQRLSNLAQFDPLTELPNRSLFRDRLSQAIARAQREDRLVALVFLDLDHFKEINDTLGHEAGDLVLKAVGTRLRACLREGDTIARLGGDEFTVIVEGLVTREQIGGVARKLLRAFSSPVRLEGKDLFVTASMGIALFPTDSADGDGLLKHADVAMYHAKSEGRNNYQYYTATMTTAVADRMTLETSLRRALERAEFVLHYQPIIRLEDGAIVGAEALLRWQHPDLGLVPPGQFIQVAEQTGLIVPIGEWVLQTACAESATWQKAGAAPIRVAINLSARQFRGSNLVAVVTRALQGTGLDGDLLELEITEGLLMENPPASAAVLAELKRLGIQIAVDDFGTGYSSLSYLKHFPLDILKIDQSFVRDVSDDADVAAIVKAIIGLARSLQLSITGEGVETQSQRGFLVENQCDCAQGYLFSRPVPAEEFRSMLGACRT